MPRLGALSQPAIWPSCSIASIVDPMLHQFSYHSHSLFKSSSLVVVDADVFVLVGVCVSVDLSLPVRFISPNCHRRLTPMTMVDGACSVRFGSASPARMAPWISTAGFLLSLPTSSNVDLGAHSDHCELGVFASTPPLSAQRSQLPHSDHARTRSRTHTRCPID